MTLFELRDKRTLYVNRLEGEHSYGKDLLVKHVNDIDISEILKRVSQSITLLKDLSEALDSTNKKLSFIIDPSEEELFEKEVDKDFSMIISAVECRHELDFLQSNLIDRQLQIENRQSTEKADRQFIDLLHRQAQIQILILRNQGFLSKKCTQPVAPSGENLQAADPNGESLKAADPSGESVQAVDPGGESVQAVDPSGESLQAADPIRGRESFQAVVPPCGESLQAVDPISFTLR